MTWSDRITGISFLLLWALAVWLWLISYERRRRAIGQRRPLRPRRVRLRGMDGAEEWTPVVVVWADAHALTGSWTDLVDIDPEPRLIRSAGFLVPDAKRGHHVLVQSVDTQHVDGALAIPDAMVQEVRYLSES